MVFTIVHFEINISSGEARRGTRRIVTRNGKRLEATIPAGVRTGSLVRLRGARQITDGYYGDLIIRVTVKDSRRKTYTAAAVAVILVIIISVVILINPGAPDDTAENKAAVEESTGTTVPEVVQSPYSEPYSSAAEDILISDYLTVHINEQPLHFSFAGAVFLENNEDAVDPTWRQLCDFLVKDETDKSFYRPFFFECAQFAENVHDNAEAAGIRAGFVAVFFVDEMVGHALNAFNTTDKGLVFIDCQGPAISDLDEFEKQEGPLTEGMYDKVACIRKGEALRVKSIKKFVLSDHFIYFDSLGIVESVEIYW